jgi:Tat protein translocase TatB subunit
MDFFGIGFLEVLVVLVVAMLVLGPEQLPQTAQKLGRLLSQARKTVSETRDAFVVDLDLEGKPKPPPEARGHQPPDSRPR